MKRRTLLSLLAAGSASAALPGGWRGHSPGAANPHVLVLLELRGGNDGLNTVAPTTIPSTTKPGPTWLSPTPPLADGLAMHPALAPLLPLWQSRRLAFALGVGWPSPIAATSRPPTSGPPLPPPARVPAGSPPLSISDASLAPLVALGPSGSPAMEGGEVLAIQLAPAQLRGRQRAGLNPDRAGANPILRRMLRAGAGRQSGDPKAAR